MKKKILLLSCASLMAVTTVQAQEEKTNQNESVLDNTKKIETIKDSNESNLTDKSKVDSLKEDVKKIETNKEVIKKQISEIHQYIDSTEKTIMDIQNKLNDTHTKITVAELKIESLTKSINKTQQDIIKKNEELNEQKEKLGQTLSFMYENRNLGFFQFYFQTENLDDFINTVTFINIVAEENQKLNDLIEKQENKLQIQKTKLQSDKTILESAKSKLVTLKEQQEVQKAEMDATLLKHKEHESEMLSKLDEEQKAQDAIMEEINKVLLETVPNIGSEDIPLNPDQVLNSPMKPGTYIISSVYGSRVHPVLGYTRSHNGIDLAADLGSPIYSTGTGKVLFSGPSKGYGNWIVIQNDNGLFSIYGHMESENLFVKPGQRVNQGQLISAVGNSGLSSGPHLHLSIATSFDGNNFNYIDPLTVIK